RVTPFIIFQIVIMGLVFTNEYHHLIWTSHIPTLISRYNLISFGHGIVFWIFIVYVYFMFFISSFLIALAFFQAHHIHRQQLFIGIIALVPPWLVNILYVFKYDPLEGWDLTPAAFAMTGLLLAWSFFRLFFLDLTPLAREQVIEEMKDGVLVLDSSNRIVDINPAACNLIAVDAKSVIGHSVDSVLGNFLGGRIDIWSVPETYVEVFDENLGYMEFRISLLQIDGQTRYPGHLVIIRDITDRKQAQDALTRLNASLEEQVVTRTAEIRSEKELCDAILSNVSDGIMMASPDYLVQYVNPAFVTMTGFATWEVLGHNAITVALGKNAGWVRQSIETQLLEGSQWQDEVIALRKDGRTYDASFNAAPIRDINLRITGYVFTIRDVSQRKSLDRVRNSFIENITHQFRTPVTVLNLYVHLMGHDDLSVENRRHLETIKNHIDRLTFLIQDIIEMANLDSGKAISVWTDVNLPTMINTTLSDYSYRAKETGLILESNPLPFDLPMIKGDEKRLAQALGKVLENAILFTPSGGKVLIDLSIVEEEKKWVTISIIDSGPGIPDDEQEKVFERFFRGSLADSGNTIGTGLGLSIAQEIIQAHGGRITLESSTTGSTFRLWLPLN
ncbi:MAG: PAS domain S-box protein, partial [Anaerolineales bacterium]|nr:PAS domain S-box protein [Anaerolineales bacterium]